MGLNEMAAERSDIELEDQAFLSFACDHLMVETVSTQKFGLMFRLHTPVYLFENSYDNAFVKWHFGVSMTSTF